MATPYLGEVKIVSFGFAPKGWAFCSGQLLPINQNQALFSLLGTTYGGNGQTTFALPDFRGRVPIHVGTGFTLGQAGGKEYHTLRQSEMTEHNHFVSATNTKGSFIVPNGNLPANSAPSTFYNGSTSKPVIMNTVTISNSGGGQPHENRQPYSVLMFCIALQGIYPSQN